MSALAFYTKAHGYPDLANDFGVKKMIEGWSKEMGKSKDVCTLMTPQNTCPFRPSLESVLY